MGAAARREIARRKAVRIGALTGVGAVLTTVFAVTAQNGLPDYLPGVDRTTVRAAFEDTGALREGDDVRIANVRAGFIDSIELVDGRPVVTMKLDHLDEIHRDATAVITARSSLGQKYVDLYPGSDDAASLGDGVIPVSRTAEAVELDELLDVFDEETREAAGSTLREVGGGAGGRGEDLHDLLAVAPDLVEDTALVAEALGTHDGADLTELLQSAASLGEALDDQSRLISDEVRQMATTLDALATDEGEPIEETIRRGPKALASTRQALASLDRPLDVTGVAARRLRPGAEALGAATPGLRGLMREAVAPLRRVPGVAAQAVDAFEVLTPVVRDAAPTVRGLRSSMASIASLVGTLAPYSSEVMDFFENGASALALGDSTGNWLRFIQVVSSETLSGSLPAGPALTGRQPYPAPGEATTHRTNQLGGIQ